jgi:hypothetical protein
MILPASRARETRSRTWASASPTPSTRRAAHQDKPRPPETPELYRPLAAKIDANRKDTTHEHMTLGATARAAAKTQLTDLQHDYLEIQGEFAKAVHELDPRRLIKFL